MTKSILIRRAGKLVNRRTLRFLALAGTVLTVCTAVMSALGALLMVRQLQLVSAQRKALPVLQKAAEVYLRKNAPEELPQRKKRLLFRKGEESAPENREKNGD